MIYSGRNKLLPDFMIKITYGTFIAIVLVVLMVASAEFIQGEDVGVLSLKVPVWNYLGLSFVSIVLNILLAIILYIEYRLGEEETGKFCFFIACLGNVVYALSSVCGVFSQMVNDVWVAVKDVYVFYFFRQLNFVIVLFLFIRMVACRERMRDWSIKYLSSFVFFLVFIVVICAWKCEPLFGTCVSTLYLCSLYILTGVWLLIFLLTANENGITTESRELIMIFSLSGVVCNLLLTTVTGGSSYPWYMSKVIDIISMLIVGCVLFGRLMHHIARAHSALHRDVVTGVYSRKYLYSRMFVIQKNMSCHIQHFIIMCRIDNFCEFNHVRGEEFSDYILRNIANVLLMHSGKMDIVARTGGSTFVAFLYKTNEIDGVRCYNRIRAGISLVARNSGVSLNVRMVYQALQGEPKCTDNLLMHMEKKARLSDSEHFE